MANPEAYHVLNINDPRVIDRIKELEIELSAELDQPVALIAYAPLENEGEGHA